MRNVSSSRRRSCSSGASMSTQTVVVAPGFSQAGSTASARSTRPSRSTMTKCMERLQGYEATRLQGCKATGDEATGHEATGYEATGHETDGMCVILAAL